MEEGKSNFTVCVVAIPEMGHFIPVMHIAEGLVERGHTVYVITTDS